MLHFAKEKRTLHIGFRHNELRVVAKSFLFHPDTLIAKVPLVSLRLLQSDHRSPRISCLPVDIQHAESVNALVFDVDLKTLTLECDDKKEVFSFSDEEWEQLMEFLK